jgi:imidazolonepropionase-like amidohydrolase
VKIAMGTDCGTPFNTAGKNALELELLTQNGLSAAEALMATTRVAAEAIGIQGRAGTLEPGKWADIRVFQQAERISCVIKAGQIVKGTIPGIPVAVGR